MSTAWRGAPENGGGVELRDSWGVEHQPKNLLCAPGALGAEGRSCPPHKVVR